MKKQLRNGSLSFMSLAAAVALASCGGKSDQQSQQMQQMQQAAPAIAVATVSYGSTDFTSDYPATIKGKTDIQIRPQVSGFITKVHVDEGDHVKKGQVLFTIDQVQFQAAVDQAQAAVESAKTAVRTAKLTAEQKQNLFNQNIISEYENQLAKNTLSQAQAQLANAEAALVTAKKNLSYTEVTSPSDGVVGSIPSREGSLASPSMAQPLTTVSDNTDVYAYFSLNEKDLLRLTNNGTSTLAESIASMPEVELRLADGTIYPHKGKIATVSGVIDNATGAATVRALFPNMNGMLRSGSTGKILIPGVQDSVLIIPQKATFELQDKKFVFVLNDSNRIVSTPIQVSPVNDGKVYVVTSGLSAGQVIPVEGIGTKLRNGMEIRPIDAAAQAAMAAAQGAPAGM